MKYLIGFIIASLFAGPALAHSDHSDPYFEMGQVVTCQAMHIVLAHLYVTSVAALAVDNDAPSFSDRQITLATQEFDKAKYINIVEDQAIIPSLRERGMTAAQITAQTDDLLQHTVDDINQIVSNPLLSGAQMFGLLQLLRLQSLTCDKFVATTEAYHTI